MGVHRFIVGHVLDALRLLPDESVHCVVTSPPYWGLRDYGLPSVSWPEAEYSPMPGLPPTRVPAWEGQLGLEPKPEMYVGHLVLIFREVRRVLRRDGTLWLNLGDSYASPGKGGPWDEGRAQKGTGRTLYARQVNRGEFLGLKPKDLVGIPWRAAFALQGDGWFLRSDVVWCLSGGTWVYARTPKAEGPVMLKDLARMDHRQVELWNGARWVRLLGMSKSRRNGEEIEIVLRSGERISCTPNHKFPTERGLLEARNIRVGDRLLRSRLPEPKDPLDTSSVLDEDAAWLAGFYIANGSRSGYAIQLSTHKDKVWIAERLERIACKFGGSSARFVYGNELVVHLYGKLLHALLDELVSGDTAKNKRFSPKIWRFSNKCLEAALDGYLAGNGSFDERNNRWRLGFCRNYELERDLRTLCARLGYVLTLKQTFKRYQDKKVPTFRGEIRKIKSGHWNEQSREEVTEIRKARCREVYDLGVDDPAHLFALASGILTHNSKPNSLPESVKDRPTNSHEYVFLLAKSVRYFYDAEAVKEPASTHLYDRRYLPGAPPREREGEPWNLHGPLKPHRGFKAINTAYGRNRRSVWAINTEPFPGTHFAVFPKALAEICILAGTSPKACPICAAPWQRVVEKGEPVLGAWSAKGAGQCDIGVGGMRRASLEDGSTLKHAVPTKTVGWQPGCRCSGNDGSGRCVVLDPFGGAGTVTLAAIGLGRDSVYIDLKREYAETALDRCGLREGTQARLFRPEEWTLEEVPPEAEPPGAARRVSDLP